MKKIIFIIALSCTCGWVDAQTYLQENFDTEIPTTWTITDEGGAVGDSWISGQQGGGNSLNGSNCAIVDSDANGNGTELIETLTSPSFDTTGATSLFLDFEQYYNNIGDDTAVVEVYDGSTWIELLNQTADVGAFGAPDEQHIDITMYSNANMQIRFVYNDGNVWAWYWLVDNVQVYNSTCNFPTDLAITNITGSTADLSWTPGGTETVWEVINQEAGGPVPGDADSGIVTANIPFTATGLVEGTDYEFYVRADCAADGTSIWVGPFAYRLSGPGEVCENAIAVTTPLPYVTTDDTSNYIDDYNGAPGTDCGSGFGYLNGDDVVYAYTPNADTSIDIALTGLNNNYAGVFVYTDCANIGTLCEAGVTNGFSQNDLIIDNLAVSNGQTYYIVISTWAAPQSVSYTLTITENTCVDPVLDFTVRQDCLNGPQFFVDVDLTDLGSATSITISDDQASAPQSATATGVFSFGPFANGTPVVVTAVNVDDANCSITSGILTQDQCVLNIVDCTQAPLQFNYCYVNNDDTSWLFESSDGSPVRLTFNSGTIEGGFDDLTIYEGTDNTGAVLFNNNVAGVNDFAGLTFDSIGDSLFMELDSDGSVSCSSGSQTEWDFTASCATCVNPVADYTVREDCLNGPQFFVDVNLTDLGSATSITISDNQASTPQTVTAAGIVSFGPFANNTPVEVTVTNDDDPNCSLNSSTLTQEFCLNNVVDCAVGPINAFYCYEDNDTNLFSYTSSDGSPVRITINSGEIEGAPFDFLLVLDSDGTTVLYNDEGNDGVLDGLVFQSTGDTIFFQITSDGSVSCSSGSFCCSDGIDYTVTCATCINPSATYQVIDDCANGDQFLVDVNITSLGDATSLTISNNIDTNTVAVNSTGIYQVGPFPFGVDVIITSNNDQDVNCVINSNAIQLLACPPSNDNPCNATLADVNPDDSCNIFTSGTLLEATDSGIPLGSCGGNPDDDVWFEFTALEEFQIIQLLNIDGSGFFQNLDHALYEGTCDTPIELYCSADEASITPSLTVGSTYYIRVFSAGGDGVDYTFDLCIRPGGGNVVVDQDTYTVEELITDILIDSPCAQVSNITWSTGTNFGDVNGIGYFTAGEGDFPFEEGILLTSGDASRASGPNFNAMSDGGFDWVGDADLDAAVGIMSNNASIIEFDFVPLTDEISFDFLMASEEYNGNTGGTFECTFSDAFAFLLTDQNGVTTNLAVLPGTTTPILVTNIHPANPGCPAINEEYFGGYTPQNLPPMSFDGRTTVFTASSAVTIGQTYSIKLVMADATDTALDSGVFLKAGSFDIGDIDLGVDITVASGNAACVGEDIILQTEIESIPHFWFKDGIQIPGESSNTLIVTEPGLYTVQIILSPTCPPIEDVILVEFLPEPIATMPDDLVECSTTDFAVFDLNVNTDQVLAGQSPTDFTLTYHETEDDAISGNNPLTSPYANTSSAQVIYVRVVDNATGCFNTTTFSLLTSNPSFTAESVDIIGCDNDGDGFAEFDLDAQSEVVLGEQDASQFIVTYHSSQADADSGANALDLFYTSEGETVYVRVESIDNVDCFVTNSFQLTIGLAPVTTFTEDFDYQLCPDATVPIIIEATPENYDETQVAINWYYAVDGSQTPDLIEGENGLTLSLIEGGIYTIEVIFNDTGCFTRTEQEVITLGSCFIPQGISPNGDGLNDVFDLSNFRVRNLEIYNRLGTCVYKRANYVDEWFGQSDNGDELPVGTYFYSVDFEDRESETGWVYLQRSN